jgi:hypothetical protein
MSKITFLADSSLVNPLFEIIELKYSFDYSKKPLYIFDGRDEVQVIRDLTANKDFQGMVDILRKLVICIHENPKTFEKLSLGWDIIEGNLCCTIKYNKPDVIAKRWCEEYIELIGKFMKHRSGIIEFIGNDKKAIKLLSSILVKYYFYVAFNVCNAGIGYDEVYRMSEASFGRSDADEILDNGFVDANYIRKIRTTLIVLTKRRTTVYSSKYIKNDWGYDDEYDPFDRNYICWLLI